MSTPIEIDPAAAPAPQLTYGFVVWKVQTAVADTAADPDRLPDAAVPEGTITFTFLDAPLRFSEGVPVTVVPLEVVCSIDYETGELVDPLGVAGVWLVTGRYRVVFRFTGFTLTSFEMQLTDESTPEAPADLTLLAPLVPTPGVRFVVNEQVYQDTLAASDAAVQAASNAAASAAQAQAAADAAPNWWTGTQSEYDALGTWDPQTLYLIRGTL